MKVTVCEIKEFQKIISVKMNYFPQQNSQWGRRSVPHSQPASALSACLLRALPGQRLLPSPPQPPPSEERGFLTST